MTARHKVLAAMRETKRARAAAMTPEEVAAVVAERDRMKAGYLRMYRRLTDSTAAVERAVAMCEGLTVDMARRGHEAVFKARQLAFGSEFDGAAACEIEDVLARAQNPVMVLFAYEAVAPAIKRQLEASLKDGAKVA